MQSSDSRSIFPWLMAPKAKGQTEGNHRLTALTGTLLTPLLALIFVTGLFMDAYWHIHYVVGFMLIPVVALKLASTGYRVIRYYTHCPIYREAGPPDLISRMLAPLLVLSIVTALTTGVALFLEQSRGGILSTLHTDSAVLSAVFLGIHLLTHLPDALAATVNELHARLPRPTALRIAAAVAALALGIVLAIATYTSGVWPARPHRREGLGFSVRTSAGAGNRAAARCLPATSSTCDLAGPES